MTLKNKGGMMYSIGHTFIDKLYHLEFRVVKTYEQYGLHVCETTTPNKDPHGMKIGLICFYSTDYISECDDNK